MKENHRRLNRRSHLPWWNFNIFSNGDLSRISKTDFQNLNFIFFYHKIERWLWGSAVSLNNDKFKEMALNADWMNDSPKRYFRNKIRILGKHHFHDLGLCFLQKLSNLTQKSHYNSLWRRELSKIILKFSLKRASKVWFKKNNASSDESSDDCARDSTHTRVLIHFRRNSFLN